MWYKLDDKLTDYRDATIVFDLHHRIDMGLWTIDVNAITADVAEGMLYDGY